MFGNKKTENVTFEWYSIYDSKVGKYQRPIPAENKLDIIRQAENLMRDPSKKEDQLVLNAEDFSIFKVGSFDNKTGVITPCVPEHTCSLHEIKTMVLEKSSGGH